MQLNLTLEQINLVLTGLGELPARVSMELITNIQQQAQVQLKEQQEIDNG